MCSLCMRNNKGAVLYSQGRVAENGEKGGQSSSFTLPFFFFLIKNNTNLFVKTF